MGCSKSRPQGRLGWLWLTTLPPAVLIAVLIASNAVDVLFMDDWSIIGWTVIQAHSGQLDIQDLFGQANESRPLFPRLLFLVIGTTSHDTRWLLVLPFSLACLVSWSLFFLARETVTACPLHLWGLTLIANLLVFTPKVAETWLWSSYVGLYLAPVACLAASLALLTSDLGPGKKVAICAALCTVATFSFANGLANWLLVAPIAALSVGRRWLRWWALGFLLNVGLYFRDYVRPAHHPSLLDGMQFPRLGHYLLTFLGAPLGLNRPAVATAVGAVLVVLFTLSAAYLLAQARDGDLRQRMAPWLSFGGYTLLSGLAAGVGRSPFGVGQAMVNRYIPVSVWLPVALVFLLPIVLDDTRARGFLGPARQRLASGVCVVVLASTLVVQVNAAIIGTREILREGRMLRYGKSCLLFINVHPDEMCLASRVHPNTSVLGVHANALDRLGYLSPGLVRDHRLGGLRPRQPEVRDPGVFESLSTKPGEGRFRAAGWAGLPTASGPADAVILARQAPDGDWIPFDFAPVLEPRPEVGDAHGREYRNAGWTRSLIKRDLPPRPLQIRAWAFDARRGWALPLEGIHTAPAGARKHR